MNSFPAFCNPQNPHLHDAKMTRNFGPDFPSREKLYLGSLSQLAHGFHHPVFGHFEPEISETSPDVAVVRCGFQDSNEMDVNICYIPDFWSLRNLESKPWWTLHHEGLASQICNLKMGWRFPLIKHQRQFVNPQIYVAWQRLRGSVIFSKTKKRGEGAISHRNTQCMVYGIFIYTYIWLKFLVNVGK